MDSSIVKSILDSELFCSICIEPAKVSILCEPFSLLYGFCEAHSDISCIQDYMRNVKREAIKVQEANIDKSLALIKVLHEWNVDSIEVVGVVS